MFINNFTLGNETKNLGFLTTKKNHVAPRKNIIFYDTRVFFIWFICQISVLSSAVVGEFGQLAGIFKLRAGKTVSAT
jgi:hypothetical protein